MTIPALLELRHTAYLEWVEPFNACGPEGNDIHATLITKATVHDCINMQRAAARQAGRPTMGNDDVFLEDFMAVHWATVVNI